MQKSMLILVLVIFYTISYSQIPANRQRVEKLAPFSNQDVSLKDSWIKTREELNTKFISSLDANRLLHNFRINAGLPSDARPLEGWEAPNIGLRGHFVGHYLSAASMLVEKYQEPQLRDRLTYLVDELHKCQQALGNGYLSAFPEKDFETLEKKFTGVWAPYYTYHKIMQGLLDVYLRTNNAKAYEIVLGMAAYANNRMLKLDSATIANMIRTTAANPQNEMGAMNEVLYKLYKISGNKAHLELAKKFDPEWLYRPLSRKEDILSGLHSNTHLPLINGFAQRYSITKEIQFRDAVLNFWDMLIDHHAYANGTSSGPCPQATTKTAETAEHWGDAGQLSVDSKEIAESCVSHNTQKLSSYIFQWTAAPAYADVYMNMFYNAVLPTQHSSNGSFVYHLPLGAPRNKKFMKENDFFCCSGSGAEAFTQLNTGIYYHNDSALWVNLYVPSEVNWKQKNIRLEQQGSFPKDTIVDFTISTSTSSKFKLNLLIPSWAKSADLYINGKKQQRKNLPSTYVAIDRSWRNKDKIKLIFHPDFYVKVLPGNPSAFSIFYGPMLLAFETNSDIVLKENVNNIVKNLSVLKLEDATFQWKNGDAQYLLRPLFDISEQSYGVYATIKEN